MKNINSLISQAEKSGFEIYGSFNEGEGCQHEILTCTKGEFSGEVVDIYYDFLTGSVSSVSVSTQFKGQEPKFKLN